MNDFMGVTLTTKALKMMHVSPEASKCKKVVLVKGNT